MKSLPQSSSAAFSDRPPKHLIGGIGKIISIDIFLIKGTFSCYVLFRLFRLDFKI